MAVRRCQWRAIVRPDRTQPNPLGFPWGAGHASQGQLQWFMHALGCSCLASAWFAGGSVRVRGVGVRACGVVCMGAVHALVRVRNHWCVRAGVGVACVCTCAHVGAFVFACVRETAVHACCTLLMRSEAPQLACMHPCRPGVHGSSPLSPCSLDQWPMALRALSARPHC